MSLNTGSLVWAKMKGFPHWPGKIVEPLPTVKVPKNSKGFYFIQFFGSHDHAYIIKENVIAHNEEMLKQMSSKSKTKQFRQAVDELLSYKESSGDARIKENRKMDKVDKKSRPNSSLSVEDQANIKKSKQKSKDKSKTKKSEVKSVKVEEDKPVVNELEPIVNELEPINELQPIDDETETVRIVTILHDSQMEGDMVTLQPSSEKVEEDSVDDLMGEASPIRLGKLENITVHVDFDDSDDLSDHSMRVLQREQPGDDIFSHDKISKIPSDRSESSSSSRNSEASETMDVESLNPVIDFNKKFGFIGLDDLGRVIFRKMIENGLNVTLWDENIDKYGKLPEGLKADSPAELIVNCDITLCYCDTDTDAFKNIIFGENGILKGFEQAEKLGLSQKGYVGLNSLDEETSKEINDVISIKYRGLYLEAPFICTSEKDGIYKAIVIASGNRNLFKDCEEGLFRIIAQKSIFTSCEEVNASSKMKVLYSAVAGTMFASLNEVLGLSKSCGIDESDLHQVSEVMFQKQKNHPREPLYDTIYRMSNNDFTPYRKLRHVQKDINQTLSIGNAREHKMPVAAAANEVLKHACLVGYAESDITAVKKSIKY